MITRYCDCCGDEITDKNVINASSHIGRLRSSLEGERGTLVIEVMVGIGSTWNAGDFCKYCVLDALYKADNRIKRAE